MNRYLSENEKDISDHVRQVLLQISGWCDKPVIQITENYYINIINIQGVSYDDDNEKKEIKRYVVWMFSAHGF